MPVTRDHKRGSLNYLLNKTKYFRLCLYYEVHKNRELREIELREEKHLRQKDED